MNRTGPEPRGVIYISQSQNIWHKTDNLVPFQIKT